MTWLNVDPPTAALYVDGKGNKAKILARIWEDNHSTGWFAGTYNAAGRITQLIPKPYASREIAKQAVEEAVRNQKELRG